jgi:hypothetical protein
VPVETTEAEQPFDWTPWLAGLAALMAAAGLFAFLRRRRGTIAEVDEDRSYAGAEAVTAAPPPPPVASVPPAERPAVAIAFEAVSARYTLIGVTVDYKVTLHNEGEAPARDLRVGATMANAHPGQEQALARFFASPVDMPVHSIEQLGPGESVTLTGSLRLSNEALAPIRVRDRALLIPVVGFSAHYVWGTDGRGYSGAAFIVGQESDPPRERMAPFRLDQGPRQFRSIGSRLGHSALVS